MMLCMTETVRVRGVDDFRAATDRLLRDSGYSGLAEEEQDTIDRDGQTMFRTWVATWAGGVRYSMTAEHPTDPVRAEVDALAGLLRSAHARVTVNPVLAGDP